MRKLFARLMAAFLAAILVCSLSLLVIFYTTSRSDYQRRSVNILKREGRDLAYLASGMSFDTVTFGFFGNNRKYWDYIDESLLNDQDVIATLDSEQLTDTMNRVLEGEEVEIFTPTDSGTMFTVAIPWMQSDRVMGAVVIQTASQTIASSSVSM